MWKELLGAPTVSAKGLELRVPAAKKGFSLFGSSEGTKLVPITDRTSAEVSRWDAHARNAGEKRAGRLSLRGPRFPLWHFFFVEVVFIHFCEKPVLKPVELFWSTCSFVVDPRPTLFWRRKS